MKKKIAFDMGLNIVATTIPTIVLQLALLPALARYMGADDYGLVITVLSLLNMIPSTLGNVLNNTRLINISEQESTHNYNIILILMCTVNLILMGVFSYLYDNTISFGSLTLTLIVSILLLLREYHSVAFRIQLNYVNIVISNLVTVIGYGLGFFIFKKTGIWQYIYVVGYLISLVFILAKSTLWLEPYCVDGKFRYLCSQAVLLTVATFLARLTAYADKLIIFPVLGGTVVSVYYAATLLGKVVSMAINPISSVLLSYLSKVNNKSNSNFKMTFWISSLVCVAGYIICVAISRPLLSFLYPQFVEDAMVYIWITTATMSLSALASVINPFILRFYDIKWQIGISLIYVIVYICSTMLLLACMGLYGFCLGALLSIVIKLILMLYIFSKKQEKKSTP